MTARIVIRANGQILRGAQPIGRVARSTLAAPHSWRADLLQPFWLDYPVQAAYGATRNLAVEAVTSR